MKLPRLIVITDWTIPDLEQRLEAVATIGSDVAIQHRDPGAPTRAFLERARRLRTICDRTGAQLFINGRLDVALLLKAHLHLPEDTTSAPEVRRFLTDRFITVAFHEGSDQDRLNGADAAIVSPLFPAGSKPNDQRTPLGIAGFVRLARTVPVPVYALGGMDAERTRSLVATAKSSALSSEPSALGDHPALSPEPSALGGRPPLDPQPSTLDKFQGIAAISSVLKSPDPRSAAEFILHSLRR